MMFPLDPSRESRSHARRPHRGLRTGLLRLAACGGLALGLGAAGAIESATRVAALPTIDISVHESGRVLAVGKAGDDTPGHRAERLAGTVASVTAARNPLSPEIAARPGAMAVLLIRDAPAFLTDELLRGEFAEQARRLHRDLDAPLLRALETAHTMLERDPPPTAPWLDSDDPEDWAGPPALAHLAALHERSDLAEQDLGPLLLELLRPEQLERQTARFLESVHVIASWVFAEEPAPSSPSAPDSAHMDGAGGGSRLGRLLRRLVTPFQIGRRRGASATGSIFVADVSGPDVAVDAATRVVRFANGADRAMLVDLPWTRGAAMNWRTEQIGRGHVITITLVKAARGPWRASDFRVDEVSALERDDPLRQAYDALP